MTANTKMKRYSILSEVYDELMNGVDYEIWAEFIHEIIATHHLNPKKILELACGTGSLTFELAKLGDYEITATDKSPQMLEKARLKAKRKGAAIAFKQIDFLDIQLNETFNVIISVFDSVNYLINSSEIKLLLTQVQKIMHTGSIFIFDFTTPKNSITSLRFLDNRKGTVSNRYRFFRRSSYNTEQQIHYNTFQIEELADSGEQAVKIFSESHKQRTYTLGQMQHIIHETDFSIEAAYAEFDLDPADENSLRITMVLKRNS